MANTKSAIKRARIAQERATRNQAEKSRVKTAMRRVEESLAEGDTSIITERLDQAVSLIDKAAKKGVLHPNAAARRKSRLMRRVYAASQSAGL